MRPVHEPQQNHIFLPLIAAIACAIGLVAGYKINFSNNDLALIKVEEQSQNLGSKTGQIEEILRFVETNYVEDIEEDEVVVDAINHILEQLDPHSNYITPEEVEEYNEKMDGEYKGIGIETIKLRDTFYISGINEAGPAYKSGLRVGDAIIAIDDSIISGTKTEYTVMRKMLKRNTDEDIQISYSKPTTENTDIINLVPENISIPSANHLIMVEDDVAYIKVLRFNANTYRQFMESIESVGEELSPLNLIIDLRDNPGGYLPEAINILSQLFPEKGRLLTYTQGLNRKKREYLTTGKPFYQIGKIAVLINSGSASGSEILAGAIQDWDRGFIIGEPSYGKGLVQELFPLNNGGALRLTVAKYYSPSGRLIQKSYDNINDNFEADTSSHRTKLLSRQVSGGGGIVPDYAVADLYNDYCFRYFDYIDYFLIDLMRKNDTYELSDISFTDEALTSFIESEYYEETDNIRENCLLEAERFINAHYKRMKGSELDYLNMAMIDDPMIEKALSIISDRKTTLALLSDKK